MGIHNQNAKQIPHSNIPNTQNNYSTKGDNVDHQTHPDHTIVTAQDINSKYYYDDTRKGSFRKFGCLIAIIAFIILAIALAVTISLLIVKSNEKNGTSKDSDGNVIIDILGGGGDGASQTSNNETNEEAKSNDGNTPVINVEPDSHKSIETISPSENSPSSESSISSSKASDNKSPSSTYTVSMSNLDYFEDNINKIVDTYDVILFEDDVKEISFSKSVEITSDIEIIAEKMIRINCPNFEEAVFSILGPVTVKITGFELSECSRDNYGFVNLIEYGQLTLENIKLKELEVEEHNLIYCENSTLFMDNIYIENVEMTDEVLLFIQNCNSEIKNSQFKSNKAIGNIGLIISIDQSVVNIEDSKFIENENGFGCSSIYVTASDIKLENIEAKGNEVKDNGFFSVGGFACFDGSNITIEDLICEENKLNPEESAGGCLDNEAKYQGGAIAVTLGTTKIEGSEFTGNVAMMGGAIYVEKEDLSIKNSNIADNEAEYGGGICFGDRSDADISETKFTSNGALFFGGAVLLSNYSDVEFYDCEFTSNEATRGSAFSLVNDSTYYAEDTKYSKNVADYGLIGFVAEDTHQKITLKNCDILDDNIANEDDSVVNEDVPNSSTISINE